jgi:hypothetical protein
VIETDAAQQVLKALVVAQVMPLRSTSQEKHLRISLLDASFQPPQCFITLTQTVMNKREVVRRNITLG